MTAVSSREAEPQLDRLQAQWRAIVDRYEAEQWRHVTEEVSHWRASITAMAEESARAKADGRWAQGPRTLLEVLGLQAREVPLVAGLRWLLDPQGSHRLGDLVLAGLLARLDVPHPAGARSSARVEVHRPDEGGRTRADLVLRVGPVTVLIEAKVQADDHEGQCDRLARLWAAERPTLVFLTLAGQAPRRSPCTAEQWLPLTWADVAQVVERAVAEREPSPGALDLLHTLNHLHPTRRRQARSSNDG